MSRATGTITSFDSRTGKGVIALDSGSKAISNGTMNGLFKFDIKDVAWRGGSSPAAKMTVTLSVERGRVTAVSPE